MNAFKPYVEKKQDIVFVCISSELSATCQNANLVANMIDDITIKVVDSRNVALGTGIVAYKAAKYAQEGLSADEIEEKLLELVPKVFTGFVLDKLDFLRRGGRCSALQAFAATSLKLRPEIVAKDGKLVPGGKFRGSMDKVVKGYFSKKLADLGEIDDEMVFVVTTVDEMGLSPMSVDIVKRTGYFKEVIVADAGCVITAHSGPNTYGLFFIRK
jgi:DegV family protein with EDD domain